MKPEGKGIEGQQDPRATQGIEGHGEDLGAWGGGYAGYSAPPPPPPVERRLFPFCHLWEWSPYKAGTRRVLAETGHPGPSFPAHWGLDPDSEVTYSFENSGTSKDTFPRKIVHTVYGWGLGEVQNSDSAILGSV